MLKLILFLTLCLIYNVNSVEHFQNGGLGSGGIVIPFGNGINMDTFERNGELVTSTGQKVTYYSNDGYVIGHILPGNFNNTPSDIINPLELHTFGMGSNLVFTFNMDCVQFCGYAYENTSVNNNYDFQVTLTVMNNVVYTNTGSYFCMNKCFNKKGQTPDVLTFQSNYMVTMYVERSAQYNTAPAGLGWLLVILIVMIAITVGICICVCCICFCCWFLKSKKRRSYSRI